MKTAVLAVDPGHLQGLVPHRFNQGGQAAHTLLQVEPGSTWRLELGGPLRAEGGATPVVTETATGTGPRSSLEEAFHGHTG